MQMHDVARARIHFISNGMGMRLSRTLQRNVAKLYWNWNGIYDRSNL